MQMNRYFYITTLPALGDLGSIPAMGLADLVEHVRENRRWSAALETLVLLDDLQQREALLAGETDEVEPAVLSFQQARGEAPLHEALDSTDGIDQPRALAADLLWERYFRYAHQAARVHRSHFLSEWVEFEVDLRNALAVARARRLGLEESDYCVATELAHSDEDLSAVLSDWEAAATPLAGLQAIIRIRWSWLDRHDSWFSFSVDELLAYAARVMLLQQWRRTERQEVEMET